MATGGGETLSDELITLKCNVCSMQNKTRDAEKYCTECQEYYCIPCSDMHKMFVMFKGHNLLTKEDFDGTVHQGSLPHIPTERCSKHAFRVLDMYCEDHDVTFCASCIADHRVCLSIRSIPNELETLYPQQLLEEMKNKLKTVTKEIEDVAAAKQVTLKELQQSKDKAVEAVETFRKEIDTFFDNLEKSLIEEIDYRFKTLETEITAHISETEKLVENLQDASAKLQSSEGNRAQEFVSTKSVEKDMDKSRRALDSILKHEVKTVDFEVNPEFWKLLQQIKSLGTQEFVSTKSVEKDMDKSRRALDSILKHEVKTVDFDLNPEIWKLLQQIQSLGTIVEHRKKQYFSETITPLYKIKRQSKINVKLPGDYGKGKCIISGACMTENGFLLLADYNNCQLKRLNLSSKAIKNSIFLQDPRDVCVVSSTEAGVCHRKSSSQLSRIQIVTLGDQMTASRSFDLDHLCVGIAYHDGKLFTSDNKTAVYAYDLAGKILLKTTTDALGRTIFSKCRKITISTLTNEVYVADPDKGVVKLDTQGRHLSTFSDLASMRPAAISTDGNNMFVAGEKSNSVMQIGSDGKIIGSFGDVSGVESLCFDSKSNTLIVSENERDFIKIYELE